MSDRLKHNIKPNAVEVANIYALPQDYHVLRYSALRSGNRVHKELLQQPYQNRLLRNVEIHPQTTGHHTLEDSNCIRIAVETLRIVI
jgi:hypothetical protein